MNEKINLDDENDVEKMIEISEKFVTTRGAWTILFKHADEEIKKIENATWADWDNILTAVKSKYKL